MSERKRNRFGLYSLIILIALLAVGFIASRFLRSSSLERARARACEELERTAAGQAAVLRVGLDGQYAQLATLASSIAAGYEQRGGSDGAHDGFAPDALLEQSNLSQQDGLIFLHIDDGVSAAGVATQAELLPVLENALAARLGGQEAVQREAERIAMGDGAAMLISVPVSADGETIGILGKLIGAESFKNVALPANNAVNKSYSTLLCDGEGNILAGSGANGFAAADGIFALLRQATFELGAYDAFERDIRGGEPGVCSFELNGAAHLATYSPTGINGWMLVNVTPNELVAADAEKIADAGCRVVGMMMAAAVLLLMFAAHTELRRNKQLVAEKERYRVSEEEYRIAAEHSGKIVYRYDILSGIAYLATRNADETNVLVMIPDLPQSLIAEGKIAEDSVDVFTELCEKIKRGEPEGEGEFLINSNSGSTCWYNAKFTTVYSAKGEALHSVISVCDVSERHAMELAAQNLERKAYNDSLTGLFNHDATLRFCEEYINGEGRELRHCMYVMDLDGFKAVNDKFGHQQGDKALIEVAERIKSLFRGSDIVGRMGGDEFMVLMKNVVNLDIVRKKAILLCETLQFALVGGAEPLNISCSVGAAMYDGNKSIEELYGEADAAMYEAKHAGKSRYVIANPDVFEHFVKPEKQYDPSNIIQLNALLSHMDGGVLLFEVGESINTLYASASYFKMTGSISDIVGKPFNAKKTIPEEDDRRIQDKLREGAGSVAPIDATYRVLLKDGSVCWRHLKAVRIPYESDAPVLIAVLTDITELKNSSTQMDFVVQHAPGGVALCEITDDKVCAVFSNHRLKNMMGLDDESYERLVGVNLYSIVHKDDIEGVRRAVERSVSRRVPIDITFRIRTPNAGKILWIMLRAAQVDTKSGHPLFMCMFLDITKQKQLEQELSRSEQQLKFAFEQTQLRIWTGDISNNITTLAKEGKVYLNLPESAIRSGLVEPDSADKFRAFSKSVLDGKESGFCVVQLKLAGERYSWYKLSFRNIFNADGSPYMAVGVTEHLPSIAFAKADFEREERLVDMLRGELLTTLKVNITKNRLESKLTNVHFSDGARVAGSEKSHIKTYDELYDYMIKVVFNATDAAHYESRLSAEAIHEAYERGSRWVIAEYRVCDDHGVVRWASSAAMLLREPISGDIYGFAYVQDIDSRKRRELALPRRVEHDPTTYLYNEPTMEALINEAVRRQEGEPRRCALAVVEVQGLDMITESLGFDAVNRVLETAGKLLWMISEADTLPGRMSAHRYVLFLPTVVDDEATAALIQRKLARLDELMTGYPGYQMLTFAVGVSTSEVGTASFEVMYEHAAQRCQRNFEKAHLIYDIGSEQNDTAVDFVALTGGVYNGESNGESGDALIKCLAALVGFQSYDMAAKEVFRLIGEFYQADRVLGLSLDSGGGSVTATYEWRRSDLAPIASDVCAVPIQRYPAVEQANNEKRMVRHSAANRNDASGGAYGMIAMPMQGFGGKWGFISIYNPRANNEDEAFLPALIPLMVLEQEKRMRGMANLHDSKDQLTGLLDRDSYLMRLQTTNGDAISSFGIMYADVNDLSGINREYGSDFGDGLLQSVAVVISRSFRERDVYRISGDEMVVVCADVTRDSFYKCVSEVQTNLDIAHPGGVSLGYTWTDKDIVPHKVVDNAEGLMRIAKQEYYREQETKGRRLRPQALMNLLVALQEKKFEVFLQPKAETATGEIVGAEALVRMKDSEKGYVSPSEFIGILEREHVIKHLDFFVLEETLKLIQSWRREGRRAIPVSVNFSRVTLLDPGALAGAQAIIAEYDVPMEYIEIEVTESIGEIERETVARACEAFREKGFRLALDDFGSSYSNLAVLSDIRFDTVKLDKSLVNDFVFNPVSHSIVESMVKICEIVGSDCVAEGVESEEQVRELNSIGCKFAQGYYYNKPLPADRFTQNYLPPAEGNSAPAEGNSV